MPRCPFFRRSPAPCRSEINSRPFVRHRRCRFVFLRKIRASALTAVNSSGPAAQNIARKVPVRGERPPAGRPRPAPTGVAARPGGNSQRCLSPVADQRPRSSHRAATIALRPGSRRGCGARRLSTVSPRKIHAPELDAPAKTKGRLGAATVPAQRLLDLARRAWRGGRLGRRHRKDHSRYPAGQAAQDGHDPVGCRVVQGLAQLAFPMICTQPSRPTPCRRGQRRLTGLDRLVEFDEACRLGLVRESRLEPGQRKTG